jgi:glutamate/tyrosine decarboxylase-like PLP-dependent enzyme
LGRAGIAQIVGDCCDHARRLTACIGVLSGAEIVCEPELNQGLVRFIDPSGDHDSRTDRVIAAIQQDGRAWFGATTFNGMRAMRVSAVNHCTPPMTSSALSPPCAMRSPELDHPSAARLPRQAPALFRTPGLSRPAGDGSSR